MDKKQKHDIENINPYDIEQIHKEIINNNFYGKEEIVIGHPYDLNKVFLSINGKLIECKDVLHKE